MENGDLAKYRGFPCKIVETFKDETCVIKATLGTKIVSTSELEPRYTFILCAAIHYLYGNRYSHQPKNIDKGYVLCGRRHHNCILTGSIFGVKTTTNNSIQGFLTSIDTFVNREEAGTIAYMAKQTDVEKNMLFSEDLW